jgi:hypothetical protein
MTLEVFVREDPDVGRHERKMRIMRVECCLPFKSILTSIQSTGCVSRGRQLPVSRAEPSIALQADKQTHSQEDSSRCFQKHLAAWSLLASVSPRSAGVSQFENVHA